jgi:hypothetical protein
MMLINESLIIYVFNFIPVTFSTFHIHEICQIENQNLHIATVCVTVDLMAVVFTHCVGMCMICLQTKFLLLVSSGLLAVTIKQI